MDAFPEINEFVFAEDEVTVLIDGIMNEGAVINDSGSDI